MLKYRLGIDLGATSLGWAIYDIERNRVVDSGVRIFDDGRDDQSKASLCVARREARGLRRLFKRRVMKKTNLIKALIEMKLLPENEAERQKLKDLNPYRDMKESTTLKKDKLNILKRMPMYALRAKALDEKLEPYEIGRVLIHLGQRKGFLSNRKSNKDAAGMLSKGNDLLKRNMKECFKEGKKARTYGGYLYLKHLENPNEPIRLKKAFQGDSKEKKSANNVEFPYRDEYKNEFKAIWDKQQEFYPELLNDENRKKICNILFFQRPLKEPEVGFCHFEPGERRIAKAHPLFQEFRIRQMINNVKISKSDGSCLSLNSEQREKLFDALYRDPKDKRKISEIRELLGLKTNDSINYEDSGKERTDSKAFPINKTELAIKKSESDELKNFWNNLDDKGYLINFLDRPGDIIKWARTAEDQDKKIIECLSAKYNLSEEAGRALLNISFEDGYGNLSEKAISKILTGLREGLLYNEACEHAGYNHSEHRYEKLNVLPYYGEILKDSCLGAKENHENDEEKFGKISNVTVHIALNQVRLLVNELIKRYGKPSDISIEYARDLNASAEERKAIKNRQTNNEKHNDKIREDIKKEYRKKHRVGDPSNEDIKKYKIWESMGKPNKRICPYTGKQISIEQLLSSEIEVDHILPFSRTFDDSMDNKVVCFREANRYKANRTPYEAFKEEEHPDYSWTNILKNIKSLNEERQWRFSKDAIQQFNDMDSPIARSLNDTRYMTRRLQHYLLPIVHENGYKTVQSVRGGLTAMVRNAWGLNLYKEKNNPEKYRTEHYHHAVDAIIISAIDRGQIEDISRALKMGRTTSQESLKQEFKDELWKLAPQNRDKTEKEDVENLKKRIKKFLSSRHNELVEKYVKKPENLERNEIKNLLSKINISHKPNLKDVRDSDSTIGQLHEETAFGLSLFSKNNLKGKFHTKEKEEDDDDKKKDITKYVPIFRNKKDRDEYFDAYKRWFINKGKSGAITDKEIKAKLKQEKKKAKKNLREAAKEIKAELKQEEEKAKENLCEAAKKAFKWHVGGNNFCLGCVVKII